MICVFEIKHMRGVEFHFAKLIECEWYQSLTAHQHQKGHIVLIRCKLSYESKQSPPEKYAMVKWMQSPRQNVKSHLQKKSSNEHDEQGNAHNGPRPAKVAG